MTTDIHFRPKGSGRRAAIVASLAGHLAIFAVIGVYAPRLIYHEPPPLQATNIWLMPRLTLDQHKPIQSHAAVSAPRLAAAPKTARPAPAPSPVQSAPVAAPGKAPPSGAKPAPAPSEPGVDGGQGVREALRTSVGCDADPVVHLTPGERDHCDRKGGEIAKRGPAFSGMDIGKRGRFDAQAEADERRRAAREGPMESPVDCNLYPSCLPPSAIKHVPF